MPHIHVVMIFLLLQEGISVIPISAIFPQTQSLQALLRKHLFFCQVLYLLLGHYISSLPFARKSKFKVVRCGGENTQIMYIFIVFALILTNLMIKLDCCFYFYILSTSTRNYNETDNGHNYFFPKTKKKVMISMDLRVIVFKLI